MLDIEWVSYYYLSVKDTLHCGGVCVENKLEELRGKLDITQEDLASALGVSRQTIISIEKGRYNPSLILAFKIANYFELHIEDVFLFEEEKK